MEHLVGHVLEAALHAIRWLERHIIAAGGESPPSQAEAHDNLTVAGVNGTLLAIAFAGFVGYVIFLAQGVREKMIAFVDAANRLTSIKSPMRYLSSPPGTWRDWSKTVGDIVFLSIDPTRAAALPSDPARRGKLLTELLHKLSGSYPLQLESGTEIHGEDGVNQWLDDADEALGPFNLVGMAPWAQIIHNYIAIGMSPLRTEMHKSISGTFPALTIALSGPDDDLEELQVFAKRVSEVVAETKSAKAALQRYRKRLPRRAWVIAASVFGALAFTAGVLLPLVWSRTPHYIDLYVPAAVYGLAILVGLIMSFRYRER